MLTRKARYAMLALSKLVQEYEKGPVAMSEIARHKHIPQRFLEGILLQLKRCGYLGSARGVEGGYFLIKDPSTVTVGEVISHLDECMSFVSCLDCSLDEHCEFEQDPSSCGIRRIFSGINTYIDDTLSHTYLSELV